MPERKKRLLIVDDEPAMRLLLCQIFARMGHDVACAADGLSALEQIRHTVPDVILSDLNMPGMSGFEFLSVIRRRLPAIYVIAMSSAYSGSTIPNGVSADAFYEKATGLDALFKMIRVAVTAEMTPIRGPMVAPPIWISKDRPLCADPSDILITYPECLRSFACVHDSVPALLYTANCIYCGAAISYAIVEVQSAVSQRAYHAELDFVVARASRAHGANGSQDRPA